MTNSKSRLKHFTERFAVHPKFATPILLFVILAIGAFLRFYKIDFKSLWLDELYSIVPVNPLNSIGFIINHSKSDQPPLFFLLLHYWFKLTSYTPFFGRMLSAIFGLMSVLAIFFLGKEIRNERTGLFAAFLTSINYYNIYYSQELRFYSLLFLLTVISFIFFIKGLKERKVRYYVLYVLATVALLYTQYFGMIIFAIQGFIFIVYVILHKEKIAFILTGLFLALLIAAAFTPWLPTVLYDSQISSYWVPTPKPYFFAVYYYLYWGKDIVSALLLLATGSIYLLFLYRSIQHKNISTSEMFIGFLLISWIVLSYAVPYLRSVLSTPMLLPRYTLVTLPAIMIVAASGFDLVTSRKVRGALVFALLASSLINLFFLRKHYTTHDKAQWREAAQVVIDNHEPNVKVYSNMEWWYNYYFYSTDPRITVLGKYSSDEKKELAPFISEMENEKKFWVLNGEGAPGLNGLQQEYVDRNFRIEKRYDFFGASAVLYAAK